MTDASLEADGTAPVKLHHTAKRIFERLRDEHGYAGGQTVVKDIVRIARRRLAAVTACSPDATSDAINATMSRSMASMSFMPDANPRSEPSTNHPAPTRSE